MSEIRVCTIADLVNTIDFLHHEGYKVRTATDEVVVMSRFDELVKTIEYMKVRLMKRA